MALARPYAGALIVTLAIGIASRSVQTGSTLSDKYLGDGLYAVAIYLALAMLAPTRPPALRAILATAAVVAIECFQLTGLPADWRTEDSLLWRAISVVLGTTFGWWDVVAYLVAIAVVWAIDNATIGRPHRGKPWRSSQPQ